MSVQSYCFKQKQQQVYKLTYNVSLASMHQSINHQCGINPSYYLWFIHYQATLDANVHVLCTHVGMPSVRLSVCLSVC